MSGLPKQSRGPRAILRSIGAVLSPMRLFAFRGSRQIEAPLPQSSPLFLKSVSGPSVGRVFALNRDRSSIGMHRGYAVRLPDVRGTASIIERRGTGLLISPGSGQETFVNGEKLVSNRSLSAGDRLKIAMHEFEVTRWSQQATAAAAAPAAFQHVVIIPTKDRPEKLASLLRSMRENTRLFGYNGKIKIVVADDSSSAFAHKNKALIHRIQREAGEQFSFFYYDKADQDRLAQHLREKLAPQKLKADEFLFEDNGKKGYGGVRNMASLLALRHVEPSDIITFLDDDVNLKNVVFDDKGNLRRRHVQSYFHALDAAFAKPEVNVVGGSYTGDTGGAAFHHLTSGLDYLHYFFSQAAKHGPQESAQGVLKSLWKAAPPTARTTRTDFKRGVAIMGNLAEQLARGRFRFTLGLFPSNKQMHPSSYHVAGNLSMRASALANLPFPILPHNARGEDVIWSSTFNKLHGGVYYLPNPVGHLKDINGRRIVSDAVRDAPCHVFISSLRDAFRSGSNLLQVASSVSEADVARHSATQRRKFSQKVAQWRQRTSELDSALSSGWWARGESAPHVAKVRETVRDVKSAVPGIMRQVDDVLDPGALTRAIKKYGFLATNWAQVCSVARGFA